MEPSPDVFSIRLAIRRRKRRLQSNGAAKEMKDKSLIWLAAGGIALWVFVGYPPAREALFQTTRHVVKAISEVFR
jgi:hypothetical protein